MYNIYIIYKQIIFKKKRFIILNETDCFFSTVDGKCYTKSSIGNCGVFTTLDSCLYTNNGAGGSTS
jgi:hypothetical protein